MSANQASQPVPARRFRFRQWPSDAAILELAMAAVDTGAAGLVHDGRPCGGFTALVQGAAATRDPDSKLMEFACLLRSGKPGEVQVRVARILESVDLSSVPTGPWPWVHRIFGVPAPPEPETIHRVTAGPGGPADDININTGKDENETRDRPKPS